MDSGNSWVIETDHTKANKVLVLTLGQFTLLYKKTIGSPHVQEVDLMIYELDSSKYGAEINNANIYTYLRNLEDKPNFNNLYGFASWSYSNCFDGNLNQLDLDAAYEVGMQYLEENNDSYTFLLADKHKGNDYYKGTSGAPITDSSGRIVSIVLSGDNTKNVIYGLALSNFCSFINTL
ncbi:MAG: hypothetical protein V1773_04670 [bacterium]